MHHHSRRLPSRRWRWEMHVLSMHLSELHTLSKVQESKSRLFQREEIDRYSPGIVGEERMHMYYVPITLKRGSLALEPCCWKLSSKPKVQGLNWFVYSSWMWIMLCSLDVRLDFCFSVCQAPPKRSVTKGR